MHKLISAFLALCSFTYSIHSMDQIDSATLNPKIWEKLPQEISTIIIKKYITIGLCKSIPFCLLPHRAEKDFIKIGRLNRQLHVFVNDPQTVCHFVHNLTTYANNQSGYSIARELRMSQKNNYIEHSEYLHKNIHQLCIPCIDYYVTMGADVNYCSVYSPCCSFCFNLYEKPLLIKTLTDYNKTERLLQLGTDLNIPHESGTPLEVAIKTRNLPLIELLLSYNPRNKGVRTAIAKNSPTMVKLLIKKGNLTQQELYDGFCESLLAKKTDLMKLFADANPWIHQYLSISLQLGQCFKDNNIDSHQYPDMLEITERLVTLPNDEIAKLTKKRHKKRVTKKQPPNTPR